MKLEVGMYVRTDNGIIGKIYEKIGDMFTYKDSNRDYITYDLLHNEIIKSSYNIIDILEEGDYANGSKVQEIRQNYIEIEEYSGLNNDEPCILKSEDIKTIVTKEQMEQMAYKPMREIIDCIGETIDIVKIIKPIYNFKASE